MKQYLKCYGHRLYQIALSIFAVVALLALCASLFGAKLKRISSQLNSYDKADYNTAYVLNYGVELDNCCVFPDTDIQVYLDEAKEKRIGVSVVMSSKTTRYNLEYLRQLSNLSTDQIVLSGNAAEKYNLEVGDIVYVEKPYTAQLSKVAVVSVSNYEYDYCNPSIINNIGVVFIGADQNYIESINSKYLLFANESKAEELAEYPQIISDIINISTNRNKVVRQAFSALFFCFLLSIVMIFISHVVLFSQSYPILKRLYYKGMGRKQILSITFIEKVLLSLCIIVVIELVVTLWIPLNSFIAAWYYLIPILLSSLYIIISTIVLSGKLKKGVIR